MSFWSVSPDGSCPAVTNGRLPLLLSMMSLLPLFWMTVEAWGPTPLRPAMMGRLLLLTIPLRSALLSGTPPVSGKMLSLGCVKGRPLNWVFAMIPVTTLADGCVPPRMSCMKKVNAGVCGPTGFATVALVVVVTGDSVPVGVIVGPTTGAMPATGAATVSGSSSSGCGESASDSAAGLAIGGMSTMGISDSGNGGLVSSAAGVAGIWPFGSVVGVRPTCGVTFGTVVATGLVGWGGSGRTEGCGSTSRRTLTELAHSKVMARSKRQMALNVTRVRRESLA
ncbi:hypothetical protein F2P56_028405, partial [Juglans regia]